MSSRPTDAPRVPEAASGGDSDLRQAPLVAGRYRLKRVIARGGMGMVYLAEHAHLRRMVALKVLTPPPGADDDGSFQKRFQLEAETLAALDHPNIVTLYDYGQMEDGRYFLAMEYIDGPRFTDTVRDGPLAPDRALKLLIQVCAGLRYAHRRNLVHRDLKPSNLLIRLDDEGNEQVKVVDFGLVKVAEADQTLTKAGHVLGSPHCMSPEQVNGGEVDGRADIYAIGVLLFRSVTGVYPFHGSTAAATMISHIKEPTPPLASVAPDLVLPAGLEAVIRRCLEKSPDDRYQTVDDLVRDMAACSTVPVDQFQSVSISQSSLQHSVVAEQDALPPVPPRQRSAVLFAALGVVLALLVALIGLAALRLSVSGPGDAPATTATAPTSAPASAPVAAPVVAAPVLAATPDATPAAVAPDITAPATAPTQAAAPSSAPSSDGATPKKATGRKDGSTGQSTPTGATQSKPKEATPDGYEGLPDEFK